MTEIAQFNVAATDIDALAAAEGGVAILLAPDGAMDRAGRRANRLARGAVARLAESDSWEKMSEGDAALLSFPSGMAASRLIVAKLGKRPDMTTARKAGAAIARQAAAGAPLRLELGSHARAAEVVLGLALRDYAFTARQTGDKPVRVGAVTLVANDPEAFEAAFAPLRALAEGVYFTRDLTNEPANVLTTTEFAARLEGLRDLGVEVEVLEEDALAKLGMGALLGVGQGSASPSKLVVMQWKGGTADAPPFALVGKGVVFDTGGISLKPGPGMEDMTMDMGGAGVVAGVMRAVAGRKAQANVVGLIGLVENMPDGNAQRPGDVVTSMKGDTIEILNTDAEGRLVLADALWYAQDRFTPAAMVDLATLTGAIVVGLGNHNAGVFSNDDALCDAFLKAARDEAEGAWRMPLGPEYEKQLKSRIADVANIGGRWGGAITAAQFLKRFVKDETPWIHLDIAGVAWTKADGDFAPKGATGWGVRALDRLIAARFER